MSRIYRKLTLFFTLLIASFAQFVDIVCGWCGNIDWNWVNWELNVDNESHKCLTVLITYLF